jgi:hypothetical protein
MSIVVPVKSVRLRSHAIDKSRADAYFDHQNVSFADGAVRQFFCDVSGSFPKPEVSIWIGDRELTSEFNKTDRLVFEGPVTLKGVQVTTMPFKNKTVAIRIINVSGGSVHNCRLDCFSCPTLFTISLRSYFLWKPRLLCEECEVAPEKGCLH